MYESTIFSSLKMEDKKWLSVKEKYPIGYKFKGRVTRVKPFGIFVKLDGIPSYAYKYSGLINIGNYSACPKGCKKLPLDYSKWPKKNDYINCIVCYYTDYNMQVGLCWLENIE